MKRLAFSLCLACGLTMGSLPVFCQAPTVWSESIISGDRATASHDFEQAVSIYTQSKDLGIKDKNEYEIAESYRKMAVAYAGAGRYDDAIENFKQSLSHTNDLKDQKVLRTCILSKFGLARMYSISGNQELAWINCEEAISLSSDNLPPNDPVVASLTALKSELILLKEQIPVATNSSAASTSNSATSSNPSSETTHNSNKTLVAEISMAAPAVIPEAPSGFQKMQMQKGVLVPTNAPLSAGTQNTKLTGAANARKELAVRLMQYGTIGLLLSKSIGGPWTVTNTLNGGAAQYYGVQKGDVLAAIDGQDISAQDITSIHFMLTGKRGEIKHLELIRPGHKLELQIPLWSVYDMHDRNSEYIEYYWFLLYNNLITPEQYQRLAKPFEPYLQ